MGEKASFYTVAVDLAVKKLGRKFTRQKWLFFTKTWRISTFGTWQHWAPPCAQENISYEGEKSEEFDTVIFLKKNGGGELSFDAIVPKGCLR